MQCKSCGVVKRERLDFLAANPFYTQRFAHYVETCRSATIKEIAEELHRDWDTVKALEKQYMTAQMAKAGTPGPQVIGIDEIAIRKVTPTHRGYDLIRWRAIWFGDEVARKRSWAVLRVAWPEEDCEIRLAVMDMWKPFCNATTTYAPQAAILFDKFHIMCHLGDALDQVPRPSIGGSVAKTALHQGRNIRCSRIENRRAART